MGVHFSHWIPLLHRRKVYIGAFYLHCALAPSYVLAGIGFVAWRVLAQNGHLRGTGDMGVSVLIPADHLAIAIDTLTYGLGLPWLSLSLFIFPLLSIWVLWRRHLPWWFHLVGWILFIGGVLLLKLDPRGVVSWYGN